MLSYYYYYYYFYYSNCYQFQKYISADIEFIGLDPLDLNDFMLKKT